MSSPCLSGGGRAYGFDLEIVKPTSSSTRTSQTSSPSSTLSESSNSPLAISTRKPRKPRKRPNETYNEAAALLSTAYPTIFSTKHLSIPCKPTKPLHSLLDDSSSELLLPLRVLDNSGFLPIREKPSYGNDPKVAEVSSCDRSCQSNGEVVDYVGNSGEFCSGYDDDFDAESILDEEIEEGIDSIMGNLSMSNEILAAPDGNVGVGFSGYGGSQTNFCYGYPPGFNFGRNFQSGLGIGMRSGIRAFRNADDGNWWRCPIVDMLQISPRLESNKTDYSSLNSSKSKPKSKSNASEKKKNKKKKKKKVEREGVEAGKEKTGVEEKCAGECGRLLLKLNYEEVLKAWSDRGSPFPDEVRLESEGSDVGVCFSSPAGN